jgi:hypothetical protein
MYRIIDMRLVSEICYRNYFIWNCFIEFSYTIVGYNFMLLIVIRTPLWDELRQTETPHFTLEYNRRQREVED